MVAHLKPSASHAAHLHRFTNAALFKVLLNKLYLFICLFTFLWKIFFILFNSGLLCPDDWFLEVEKVKNPYKFTYSVFLFDLLSFILTHLSYPLSISYILYSKFKSNPCFRNLIFPVVQKSLTNLNPYWSCLVLFFCLLFLLCFRPGGTYGDGWDLSQPTFSEKKI